MHIRLIVVGDRQPSWVSDAFDGYVQRLPRQWKFRLDTVATGHRSKSADPLAAVEAEGQKVLGKVKAGEPGRLRPGSDGSGVDVKAEAESPF